MNNFKKERAAIANVISKSENAPIYAENIVEANKPSKKVIEDAVKRCHCYIGIFHNKWGWVPPNDNLDKLSVTAIEYNIAKEHGLPSLILVSNSKKEKELKEFLKKIGEYETGEWFNHYEDMTEMVGIVGLKMKDLVLQATTKPIDFVDIKNKIHEFSTKFKDLTNNKIGTIYTKPTDYNKIFKQIVNENCWIIGERGIGKSSILRKIIEDLQKENKIVLFLRAEEIISKKDFQNITKDEFGMTLNELISNINKKEDFFLIIDSVDAIQRNDEAWNSFSAEVKSIQSKKRVRMVLAIRKSDYDAFPQVFNREWGQEVFPNGFTEKQVSSIITKLHVKGKISKGLLTIFRNPFYLDILATLVKKGKFKKISHLTNQYQFFIEHYNRLVRNSSSSQLANDKTKLLYKIANKMVELKRFKISTIHLPSSPAFLSLRSDGIIIEQNNFVEFFHQTYFDFIMSLYIISKGKIRKYLENAGNELFLRSTIFFTLGYLRFTDENEFLNNIKDILESTKISHYWKLLVLEFFATLETSSQKEQKTLSRILKSDASLQGSFLQYLVDNQNKIWYGYWANDMFTEWSLDAGFQYGDLLTKYIKMSTGDSFVDKK